MLLKPPDYLNARTSNSTVIYSPVTLSYDWPTITRLIIMILCTSLGTIINGFFVSAFFVERTLKRIGYVFLACIGMADLMITTGVMPACAVVILSGKWDNLPVCRVLHFFGVASTYFYSLFFAFVGGENYFRLCRNSHEYAAFLSMGVGCVSCLVFVLGFMVAALGVFYNLDYDYCQRLHHGNFYFKVTTFTMLHIIPFMITMLGLIAASVRINRRATDQNCYKRYHNYDREISTTNLNIVVYLLYVFTWVPYLIIVNDSPDTTDQKYYYCVWFGLSRTIITNFLYCALNKNFRRAFGNLFYYCCCKSNLSSTFRQRGHWEYRQGDVRVHIMHQAINFKGTQRAAASSRETQEL